MEKERPLACNTIARAASSCAIFCNAANISSKLVQELGVGTVIGPLLTGLARPAQIVSLGATANEVVTAAALAAYGAVNDHLF